MKRKKWKTPAICLAILAVLLVFYGVLRKINEESSETEETAEAIVNMDSENVTGLVILLEGQEAAFTKSEDTWTKDGEENFPVNSSLLDSLASTFAGLTADRTLTDIEDLSEYGLDEPLTSVTLTDADGETVKISVGDENKDTGKYYVNLNDETETVYTVDVSFDSTLPSEIMDLAQGESFPEVDSTAIMSIEVNSSGGYYRLLQDDTTNWTVDDGSGTAYSAEYQTVSSLSAQIADFSFSGLAAYDVEDFSLYGLSGPAATIYVNYEESVEEDSDTDSEESSSESTSASDSSNDSDTEEEEETISRELTIYVGSQDENGSYYVRIDDSAQVHLVSEENISEILGMTASDFWDAELGYTSLENINSIDVTYGGETKEIVRNVDTTTDEDGNTETETLYYVREGELLDSDLVETFINTLNGITTQSKDMSLTSAEEPEMILVIHTDDEEKQITFTPYNENFYLAVDSEGRPGLVNRNSARDLLEDYEAIFAEEE